MPEVICGIWSKIVLERVVELNQHTSFSFNIPPKLFPNIFGLKSKQVSVLLPSLIFQVLAGFSLLSPVCNPFV